MNVLNYRTTEENGLSFDLLVDEQPLGRLIGQTDTAIPYWLFDGDLPHFRRSDIDDFSVRGISVCSCGEPGCGCAECRVVFENDTVAFRDFKPDLRPKEKQTKFRFTKANYDRVISEIMKQVRDYQEERT